MIDVKHQVNEVRRAMGTRMLEAGEARVLTIGQAYDTDLDDLWDVVTNPERIPRWFLPVSGDLRAGGRFQLQGNASGEVIACDAPRRFRVTWVPMDTGRPADVSELSMRMAVQVSAQVIGLTNSSVRGMSRRLGGFFETSPMTASGRGVPARTSSGSVSATRMARPSARPALSTRLLVSSARTRSVLSTSLSSRVRGVRSSINTPL
jgi:uncharacterized protein YndB with AHSA1/START domain